MAFSYKSYTESDAVRRAREEADKYKQYKESQNVINARNAMNTTQQNKPAAWTGGTYGDTLNGILNQINNREKFSYDLNGDALYQQYKQQYMNQGKLAMVDTIGQASALTGGYGSSYAESVGNQAYQGYLQKLNDVVPQLYQMAYDKYNNEGADLYNRFNATQGMYNTEYGQYRDTVSDWQSELDRATNMYYNEANMDRSAFESDRSYYSDRYNNERTFDYGRYSDDYSRAFSNYQQGVSESQWNRQMALEEAKFAWQKAQAAKASKSSDGDKPHKTDEAPKATLSQDEEKALMGSVNTVKSKAEQIMNAGMGIRADAAKISAVYSSVINSLNVNSAVKNALVDFFSKNGYIK